MTGGKRQKETVHVCLFVRVANPERLVRCMYIGVLVNLMNLVVIRQVYAWLGEAVGKVVVLTHLYFARYPEHPAGDESLVS